MRVRSSSVLLRWTVLSCLTAAWVGGVTPVGADEGSYRARPFGLADVRTIFVADLGSSEARVASRDALIEALGPVGFRTVERASEADAILSGSIVTRLVGGKSVVVFKTAVLRASSGETLWHLRLRPARVPRKQAERLARALRAAVEQAVWNAAQEVP